MNIEELIKNLAVADVPQVPDSEKAARDFTEAWQRASADPRELQRIRDMGDLIDAENAAYDQALAAVDRGDLAAAEPLLRASAEAGIGESAWLLAGVLEKRGRTTEALAWYQHAASDGDSRADEKIAELRNAPGPGGAGKPEGSTGGEAPADAHAGLPRLTSPTRRSPSRESRRPVSPGPSGYPRSRRYREPGLPGPRLSDLQVDLLALLVVLVVGGVLVIAAGYSVTTGVVTGTALLSLHRTLRAFHPQEKVSAGREAGRDRDKEAP